MLDDKHPKRNTRNELRDAAIRLGVRDGIDGASIRTIAREVGVTEGAVYKHFANKGDLIREAYTSVVNDMVRDKALLVKADLPFDRAVHAWIKLTYQHFDANPDAFSYVLLMPHRLADTIGEVYTKQGQIFRSFIVRAQQQGRVPEMDPQLAVAIFSGCVLNIPRLINEGVLPGPAMPYTDAVADAVSRVFAL